MNFMKNIVKKIAPTKYEAKMARKMDHVVQKRVRDKQIRLDRRFKDVRFKSIDE
jgi:hypothetical protein